MLLGVQGKIIDFCVCFSNFVTIHFFLSFTLHLFNTSIKINLQDSFTLY